MSYDDEGGNNERRTYSEGFERTRGDGEWWKRLRSPGVSPAPAPPKEAKQWVRWGSIVTREATFAIAADEFALDFGQLLDARIDLPTGWLVAFHFGMATPGSFPDIAVFTPRVLWGLGAANFEEEFPASTLNSGTPGPLIVRAPPTPAETLIVQGRALVTGNAAGSYPHTTVFSFGAFAAPQVWP